MQAKRKRPVSLDAGRFRGAERQEAHHVWLLPLAETDDLLPFAIKRIAADRLLGLHLELGELYHRRFVLAVGECADDVLRAHLEVPAVVEVSTKTVAVGIEMFEQSFIVSVLCSYPRDKVDRVDQLFGCSGSHYGSFRWEVQFMSLSGERLRYNNIKCLYWQFHGAILHTDVVMEA